MLGKPRTGIAIPWLTCRSELQGDLLNAKSQYRDELRESNTSLLMIYKYLDKMLGVDKTPVSVSRLLHRIF